MVARVVFFDLSNVTPKIYYITFVVLLNVIPHISFNRQA